MTGKDIFDISLPTMSFKTVHRAFDLILGSLLNGSFTLSMTIPPNN
jgi:hypothetical protein